MREKLLAESMLDVATLKEALGNFRRPGQGSASRPGRSRRSATRGGVPAVWSVSIRRPTASPVRPSASTRLPAAGGQCFEPKEAVPGCVVRSG